MHLLRATLVWLLLHTGFACTIPEGECLFSPDNSSVTCSGDTSPLRPNAELRAITICNYQDTTINLLDILTLFPKIQNFTLLDSSNVTNLGNFTSSNLKFHFQCVFSTDRTGVTCCGNTKLLGPNSGVRSLTVCKYPENIFNVSDILIRFPNLENFTLMNSNVTTLAGNSTPNSRLKVLNFTNLAIEKIRISVFRALNSLQTLDLRHNRLNHFNPNVVKRMNLLHKLYLKGNEWNCGKNLDWVLYLNASIVQDFSNLTCFAQPYNSKPLRQIANLLDNLQNECPKKCECSMPNVVGVPDDRGGGLFPVIQVNCSGRGLTKYPETLPQNTTILWLKDNRLENVNALINNNFYKEVKDVYLDNNLISSIDELEGAYWLFNFRVFSIKGNRVAQIPIYIFDHALQKNDHVGQIYFAGNPWKCDCMFTPSFQDFLIKHQQLMKEITEVKCSNVAGDENSNKPISTLSKSSICTVEEYQVDPLNLVNGILASLIVLILGKLAYDYYTFKKTGHLPWIVTKMP